MRPCNPHHKRPCDVQEIWTSCYMHSGTDMAIWGCTGIYMQWVKWGRSASQCLSCVQFAFGNTFSLFLKAIVVCSLCHVIFTITHSQSVQTGTILTCNGWSMITVLGDIKHTCIMLHQQGFINNDAGVSYQKTPSWSSWLSILLQIYANNMTFG